MVKGAPFYQNRTFRRLPFTKTTPFKGAASRHFRAMQPSEPVLLLVHREI
jgi:hypothetical protein